MAYSKRRTGHMMGFMKTGVTGATPRTGGGKATLRRTPASGDAPDQEGDAARWLEIGADGRVVIPAAMRRALGLPKGGPVVARVEKGELRLVPPAAARVRAREILRRHVPTGVSLADELVAERREEARREAESGDG